MTYQDCDKSDSLEEIEVTPEMIEALAEQLRLFQISDGLGQGDPEMDAAIDLKEVAQLMLLRLKPHLIRIHTSSG